MQQALDQFLSSCSQPQQSRPVQVEAFVSLQRKLIERNSRLELTKSKLLRQRLWRLMLGVDTVDHTRYTNALKSFLPLHTKLFKTDPPVAAPEDTCGWQYLKLRGDTHRTFANHPRSPSDVSSPDAKLNQLDECSLSRVLTSFLLLSSPPTEPCTYQQGMNTIAGVLLHVMPEVEAAHCFEKLVREVTPCYWTTHNNVGNIGAAAGCILADRCLRLLDPQLARHLESKGLNSAVTSFHCQSPLYVILSHHICRHLVFVRKCATTLGSHYIMGFPTHLWCALERSRRCRSGRSSARPIARI